MARARSGDLRQLAVDVDRRGELPAGTGERFAGYGIMGLPFASGHVLAMRRFAASSIGPGYTSIWHRDPDGRWEFWQDQAAEVSCPRYFSAALASTSETPIELTWTGPATLRLAIADPAVAWSTTMRSSPVTSTLNAAASVLPERAWRSDAFLRVLGRGAGLALRAGRVGLVGTTPNGQHFVANPRRVWLVAEATATVRGVDLGPPGPLAEQAALGDFAIPQRGVFAIGGAHFPGA